MLLIRPVGMNDAQWTNALAKQAEALQHLIKSEGWQIFDSYMEGELRQVTSSMVTADTADKAMKLIGVFNTITGMRAFVPRMLESTVSQLQKK